MHSNKPNQNLLREQQRLLYQNVSPGVYSSLLIALFLCYYLFDSSRAGIFIAWISFFTLIALVRLWLVILRNRSERSDVSSKQLDQLYLAFILLSALCWGTAAFLLFPEQSPVKQTIFLIVISGVAAGSISFLCSNRLAITGFLTLTLLPLSAKFLMLQEPNGIILSILVILYYINSLIGALKLHATITDNISLRLQSSENEKILKLGKERYQHIFTHSPLGIIHYHVSGQIIACNELFAAVIDKPVSELVGQNLLSVIQNKILQSAILESLKAGMGNFEGEYVAQSGKVTPTRILLTATRSTNNEILGGIGTLENFTERRFFEQKIEHQASYDSLTGLPNRRQLLELLDQEISRANRHHQNGALILMDLDNFKTINDSLGHRTGDTVLKLVAGRLKKILRKEDIIARIGGDEFGLLFPQLDQDKEVAAIKSQDIAQKLSHGLTAPFSFEERELNITTSLGISLFPEENKSGDDILQQADTAMNQAKTAGRNTVRYFLPSMQQAADKRLRLNNDLKKAIKYDEFSINFQPQVKADGTIVGAEGLLRWIHPERGLISPADFIAVAEESGIIIEIGKLVFNKVCKTVKEWQDLQLLKDDLTIAVNISAREFSTPDFVERIIKTVEETGVNPNYLDIELTEGSLISSVSDTIEKIRVLRDYGIKFSVDDFGTGYSSLSYLKSLPLHTLKIDRSFVSDIKAEDKEVNLVEIIITMAHSLGLGVVAEGVETSEELIYLAQRNCTVYQGYYFCKPISAPDFRTLLEYGKVRRPDDSSV